MTSFMKKHQTAYKSTIRLAVAAAEQALKRLSKRNVEGLRDQRKIVAKLKKMLAAAEGT